MNGDGGLFSRENDKKRTRACCNTTEFTKQYYLLSASQHPRTIDISRKKKLFNANTDDPIASFSIATSTHRLKLFSGRYSVSDRVHYSGPVHETKLTGGFRSATPNQMRNIERIIRYHSDQVASSFFGSQGWYLVQSLCPGFRACPLEW